MLLMALDMRDAKTAEAALNTCAGLFVVAKLAATEDAGSIVVPLATSGSVPSVCIRRMSISPSATDMRADIEAGPRRCGDIGNILQSLGRESGFRRRSLREPHPKTAAVAAAKVFSGATLTD